MKSEELMRQLFPLERAYSIVYPAYLGPIC